ncbi:MAG: hypothetical protein COA42_12820 [Alteromonadaceae bacterium]|nr:MAG: hypothetical protein COA42_12820 [Alteromonadaceae bacterium]
MNINKVSLASDAYQQIIGVTPHPILVATLTGEIQYANGAAELLLGYAPNELKHLAMTEIIPKCADTFWACRTQQLDKCSEALQRVKCEQLKVLRKDKSTVYIELSLAPFEAADGHFVMASFMDVNELRLTELELSRSNTELAQFAYVASHDLKAPLRGIENLIEWITEDIDDKDLVNEHIQMLRSRLQRINTLLEDLLAYSRVGNVELNVSEVNIHLMVEDLYQLSSPPKTFALQLGEPIAAFKALAAPLTQVLQNLISNAIKHNDKQEGVIKINAVDKGATIEIVVQDNGPGIDKKYHEKIFKMFEKLESKDDVEGSGMGLAMVRKITTLLGGDISIESSKGEGSKFIITWPKKPIINDTLINENNNND